VTSRLPFRLISLALLLLLVACGTTSPSPAPSVASASNSDRPTPSPTPGVGEVVAAPGSDSHVYAPNPGAIVVAIDPGHGGCLDWGVPNPWDNTVKKAEKADTLAIGLALRDLLQAQGIEVVMTRTDDSALAGDNEPDLGCNGPPWRDVDGNGEAGFEKTGRTRTRDELQARIDLANLSRADVLVSIHINSMTQNGVLYEIAATQTFYDDETPWGVDRSGALGTDIQDGVVAAVNGLAGYDRQDRGTQAVAYYLISRQWQEGDTCEVTGDTWCKPHRGLQLPSVLSEVGSMSLEAESELLAGQPGRDAAAKGVYDGLRAYFGNRTLAVRYDALIPGGTAGGAPSAVAGDGPPFWAPVLPQAAVPLQIRLTNNGSQPWPDGLRLMVGWEASVAPYLGAPPANLSDSGVEVPALTPGASVMVELPTGPPAVMDRLIGWFTLADADGPLTRNGSAALQLATRPGG